MEFKKLSLNDVSVVKSFFRHLDSKTCDFSVGGMFMWRKYYDMDYLIDDHTLFSKLKDEQGNIYFNLPISDNIENAVLSNISKFYRQDSGIKFCTIPEEYVSYFTKICPNAKVTEQTDFFDYLYNASDLISLSGKKYHNQRNLISQFMRSNADWEFVNIDLVPTEDVTDFFSRFCAAQDSDTKFAAIENEMVLEVLQNMDQYQMMGGVLLIDHKIVGFSLGEIINDTLFVHVEKADRNCKGAYQMLTQKFATSFGSEVSFINREEDMGDLGLRKAKEAYHPVSLLKKYIIEVT